MDKLKYVKEWAEDKDASFAMLAFVFAMAVDDCLEIFESVKTGKRLEGDVPLPHLKNWLGFYRNHSKVVAGLFDAIGSLDSDAREIGDGYKDFLRLTKALGKMSAEEIKAQVEKMAAGGVKEISHEELEEFFESYVDTFSPDKNHNRENIEQKKNLGELTNKAEIIFFMRVLFPCVNIYGVYPEELLRRAQAGDEDALEKLIRLDKSIIFEPKVSEIVHQAQAERVPGRMNRIKVAFKSQPKIYMTATKIEYLLGGLISFFSIMMGRKIQAVEIKKLFNAIALDFNKGGVNPYAVIVTEEYQKAIQRYRIFWSSIIPFAGQKIVKMMSA